MRNNTGAATEAKAAKRSVGSVVATVVLIACILVAIMAGYSAYTSKAGSGVPSIFGFRPFSVQSDSMAPVFYQGDLVIDRAVSDPSTLKEGDIITFWTVINGQKVLNTHRIIAITDYGNYLYFDTKGDNNTIADTTGVHQNDIVGVYRFKLANVGTVLDFLQTTAGFGVCIVLPVAIFFIYELISFFRTLMAYKTEKVRLELAKEQAQFTATKGPQSDAEPLPQPQSEEPAGAAKQE